MSFEEKLIEKIVAGQDPIYTLVYFYGDFCATDAQANRVAEAYCRLHPQSTVIRIDGIRFCEEVLLSIDFTMPECDLYIFTGIEAVAGKQIAEQQLYGILDRLTERSRQIILTGAAPIDALDRLAPRIRSLMGGGISFHVE